jgi:TonB family protein
MPNSSGSAVTIDVWQPLPGPALPVSRIASARVARPRLVIGTLVIAVHALFLLARFAPGERVAGNSGANAFPLEVTFLDTALAETGVTTETVTPTLEPITIDAPEMQDFALIEESTGLERRPPEQRPVIPFTAPRVDPAAGTADTTSFAAQAGLEAGRSATALLAVDISETGAVVNVTVQKTSGSSRADAACAEYARALRWLPGSINGEPRAMRVRFSATLTRTM